MSVVLRGTILTPFVKRGTVHPVRPPTIPAFYRGKICPIVDIGSDNEVLEKVPVTKFLGVYIDENLDWIEHIDFVKKKISGGIYALNSSKNFLSNANMRTLYYSLVHPYLLYGIILWVSAYKKYTHKLYVLQKKALRVMYNTTYNAQSMPLFEKSGILRIHDMYNLQLGVLMYKFIRQELTTRY